MLKQGSFLDLGKKPEVGAAVWFLQGFHPTRPTEGEVRSVSDIDGKGLANTYMDITSDGLVYHVNIMQVFDHRPKKVLTMDEYGPVSVWK